MNKYETIMILDTNISKESRENTINKIINYIKEKGRIEKTEDIGKRQLAYEIKKNNEGYYCIIQFELNAEDIAELERIYRITDEVLKFIVVKMEDEKGW